MMKGTENGVKTFVEAMVNVVFSDVDDNDAIVSR
jgi:hypothetical protein